MFNGVGVLAVGFWVNDSSDGAETHGVLAARSALHPRLALDDVLQQPELGLMDSSFVLVDESPVDRKGLVLGGGENRKVAKDAVGALHRQGTIRSD